MKKMKINKKTAKVIIFELFIFLPFFVPDYFLRFNTMNTIVEIWKILSMLMTIVVYLHKRKASKSFFIMLGFNLWLLLTTIINDGAIIQCLKYISGITVLQMGIELGSSDKKTLLKVLQFCFLLPIIGNLISIVIYPNGLYATETTNRNWLLGYDNTHVQYFLPGFMIALLNMKEKKNIGSIILIASILSSVIICGSTTTMVGIAVIVIFSFVPFFKKSTKIFNIRNYTILTFVIFFLIVILRLQNAFSFFIIDILHKDLTFTNRTVLWDKTLRYFVQSPIIGWGWQPYSVRHTMYSSSSIVFAHNQVLEWLYLGGIVYVLIFIYMCMYIDKISKKHRDDENVQIIHSCFLALQILWITEVYLNPIIYVVLIMCLCSDKFIETKGKRV